MTTADEWRASKTGTIVLVQKGTEGDEMEVNGVRCSRPNMAALEGVWGRRIFDHIVTTSRVDRKRLVRRNREAQESGMC